MEAGPAASQRLPRGKADPTTALALRFAILTLARRAEVAGATWAEIDLATRIWTIPADRFKGGRAQVVPLSTEAVAVLEDARRLQGDVGAFVFASPFALEKPITPHALTRALTRTLTALKLPKGSPHDFRRTGATALTGEALGFRRFVVSKVLGHSAQEGAVVTGVYDRNEYLADKRTALAAWAGHVVALAASQPKRPNVVSLRSSRG
jgi:integrase